MHRPDGLVAIGNSFAQIFQKITIQLRHRIADCVWNIDGGGAFRNDCLNHATQKIRIRTIAVFRAELDVVQQIARKTHRQPGLLEHLVGRHA